MKKNKQNELTVMEASQILGVGQRSVLNYIRSKEISAIKVGKNWFINPVSLDVFKQRYGLNNVSNSSEGLGQQSDLEKIGENKPVESLIEEAPPELKSKKLRSEFSVQNLRLFKIIQDVFLNKKIDNFFTPENSEAVTKINQLKIDAVELLGAGFYSFDVRNKIMLYNRSREKIGGILSIIYFYTGSNDKLSQDFFLIEEKLMPAYSSLIRKIENKKNERS